MEEVWNFWLKCFLVLFFGILGTNSGGDPFSQQPRIIVEDGHLTIQSAFNRNVGLSAAGEGKVQINNVDMNRIIASGQSTGSVASLNRRMTELLNQWRSINDLVAQVNQLEENVTDIAQRMSQFAGTDQNRVTNRGIRRYFTKVNKLEEKVNQLTELLNTNECNSNPCRNGGACRDSYNGFICICPSTWEGPLCENDVNECYLYSGTASGCQNGATCRNFDGGYRCDCATNWYGIHCTQQHDDCSAASHQELCGHGTCFNEKRDTIQPGQPKYRCICDDGWTKAADSPACTQDINECEGSDKKCSVNPLVICINLPGTYHCGPCPAGYTGNGRSCDDINECEQQNGGCSTNPFVECYNTPGSRRCGPCPTGFYGNGEQCMFMSSLCNNGGGCHPLATCINNAGITGSYRECRCPPGYVGSGEGPNGCIQGQGMSCANNPCQHGTCQIAGQSYHCICESGYYGTHCEIQEDPCFRNPCQNGGTCVQALGSFTCTCPVGYSGPTCANERRECGGVLIGNNGTLHYPEHTHTQNYTHLENCAWRIAVEIGKVVNVTFDHFHLEAGYNCEYDFLQLNDGPSAASQVIGRFCSDQLHGETLTSVHNEVYLWFHSDQSVSATGFTISWVAVDPVCGERFNISEYGSVNSPGYPGVYPLNRTCSWLVQVPFNKRIQFAFATLRLEHHENCSFDYLKIFDGASDRDPILGTFCSTETPAPITSSGHSATLLFHSDYSERDTGFHITYSATPAVQGCGDLVTAPQGSITSPSFPNVYDHNLQCEWLIRIHPENRIKISFTDFHLESHYNCVYDYLEIFDGPSDDAPLLGRFCGLTLPPDIISITNQVYIRFKSDGSETRPGFKIDYRTICGGVYTELTGVLTSPYYPDYYPANVICEYEIRLPVGYLVNLTIHNIDIESHYNCRYDYLEIRDGDSEISPSMALLCGYSAPESIVSTYNFLWMKFKTDASSQGTGFNAQYEAIDIGCGGIMTENNSQIISHRNTYNYPHSTTCIWIIRAPAGHFIRLSFSTFKLEGSATCNYDYVLIEGTNGVPIGKFCGARIPPILTSMDETLLIKFVTDNSVNMEGFIADYQFLDASQACGGNFYQDSGVIRSPGYPLNYPHSVNCVWVLNAGNSRQILLNVTTFLLEHHTQCNFDYLEIRNVGYETSPLIGRYCGNEILPIIRSHSNLLWMQFKSDHSSNAKGFEIYFDSTTVGCGGTLTTSRGSIVSPNYPQPYPFNADCEWLIRVSAGSRISLSIADINIEEHPTCLHDYLEVFDGDSESSKSLIRLCNNQQIPGHIESSDNAMLLRFRSDFSTESGGFFLVYQTLCNTILSKRRGVIESPNFPNPYPHNHNCTWMIKAPAGSNISISFSHIFIEAGENCSYDYVEVKETNTSNADYWSPLGKFCGDMSKPPRTIHSTSNFLQVQLITDRSGHSDGFRLEYTVNGCGGEIIDRPFGTITSPGYPFGYQDETECYWNIWYPPGSRVEFTIEHSDLEGSKDCVYDFVKVYGGEDVNAPLLLTSCHSLTNSTISSHGNQIYVHFYSDVTVATRGFKANFKKLEGGCGGLFATSLEGIIMSPGHPDPYAVNDECEWLIQVSDSNLVELNFLDFKLPQNTNCSDGHVSIYDGNNSSAPLLFRRCGDKTEGLDWQVSSTGSQMLVVLVSDGQHVEKGFKAQYKQGCGRRLLADLGGEIRSPGYPDVNLHLVNCSWIIYASEIGQKVSLTTTHLYIPDNSNCTYNSLLVFDGDSEDSPRMGQYCGQSVPPPIVSRGSMLHVFLQRRGIFRATYGLLSEHCGGSYTSDSGSFGSPGYPTNYDMNMECVWTIEASAGNKVHLTFQSFSLEESEYCNTDYVEIHEEDPSGPLIGKFCGRNIPSNVTSARKLWIKFRSDEIETTAPGFLAHYELQHGSTINGTSGFIASPGYPYKRNKFGDYEWTVIAPDGMFISVQFIDIGIVNSPAQCYSYVQIFDGLKDIGPVLGQFCGYQVPEPVVSTTNVITIVFHSDYHQALFYLHWSAVNETGVIITVDPENTCVKEYELNVTETTIITSPNYTDDDLNPTNYPDNYNCTYMIRTLPTHHVQLQFTNFTLEGPPTCPYDKLESYYAPNPNIDNWILNSTSCGYKDPFNISSPNNLLKLIMTTDLGGTYRGFKSLATAECGGHLFGSSGFLRSSSIHPHWQGMGIWESFQCEWVITVKQRRTIRLTFDNFDVPSDSGCSNTYIMVRNGASASSPLLGRYCNSISPSSLPETSSNVVYVKVVYSRTSGTSPVFDLRYEELSLGCGGYIRLSHDIPNAEISSPNYPSRPPHDMECDWIIISPASTRIRIDFEDRFEVGDNVHCYWDPNNEQIEYLQLHDGGTENAEILKRLCGNSSPSSVMTTSNALFVRYLTALPDPGTGFKANVRIASCGGTITSMLSTIQSPNFPLNYGSAMECEWYIKMASGYHIILTVNEFQTPYAHNCSLTDFLEIREMSPEGDVGDIIRTICGHPDDLPLRIDVPDSFVYVKFTMNSIGTGKGFSMQVSANMDENCGGYLQDPSGVITSPRYPSALNRAAECRWWISAPEGRKVKVTFDAMNLPKDENLDICSSYVYAVNITAFHAFRQGTAMPRICGNILPDEIDSSSSVLYIAFHTITGLNAGQGFSLRYSTEEESGCGELFTAPSGVMQSPNFTVHSDEHVDCRWTFNTDENKTLSLKFDVLDLPGIEANYCRGGALHVLTVNRYMEILCGNYTNGLVVTSPYATTSLRLMSPLSKPFGGFRGTYNTSDCGGVVSGHNSVIMSPNYPNNYPQNIYCHWFIRAPDDEGVRLTVEDMNLEEDCTKDYVKIRNGMSADSPVIGNFCGQQTILPIISNHYGITVIFHSDAFGTARGFKLITSEIQRGCGGLIHMLQGNISSPSHPSRYGDNVECVWTIEYSLGYLVKIDFFGRFDLEMDATCSKDYLQFEDMESNGTWSMRERKCGSSTPGSFVSKSNKLKITFHSNERTAGDGFTLTYTAACGGNFLNSNGNIISPNYPLKYTNYLLCTYVIGNRGDYITLTFDDFSIEGHDTCYWDYVEIFQQQENENSTQGKFCGDIIPAQRSLQGPIILKFISDSHYTSRGFKVHYEIINCGTVLTAPSGDITSPSGASHYIKEMDCTWHIMAQPNRVIALRFRYFDVEPSYSCWRNFLSIRDGNETGPLIGVLCGSDLTTVKSSGDQLTLRYHHEHITSKGFSLHYYDTYGSAQGCGGMLSSTSGEIVSLDSNSDGLYEPNLDCAWTILDSVPDQIIKLNFTRFDLEGPNNGNCTSDYVELREDGIKGPFLGRYCGSNISNPIISAASKLLVLFHTNDAVNKAGFKLKYTFAPSPCGTSALISTSTEQTLTSPNYPNPYTVNLRCKWNILLNTTGNPYRRGSIQIFVTEFDIPCNGDYLQFRSSDTRNGYYTSDTVRNCGPKHSQVLNFRTGSEITFHSDSVNDGARGFKIIYKDTSCSRNYSDDGGIITNTAYPSAFNTETNCRINITASVGRTVSLYITRFSFIISENCASNYMKIYDGDNSSAPLLGSFCGATPNPVFSNGRSLFLDIQMPRHIGNYILTYMTTNNDRGCGGSVFGSFGAFSSPLFPQAYNKTGECKWHITVPGYHTVILSFATFALNSSSGCDTNYVEIFEGPTDDISSRIVRYCGQDVPSAHESRSNEAVVKLVTDGNNNQPGFFIYFDSSTFVADPSVKLVQKDLSDIDERYPY